MTHPRAISPACEAEIDRLADDGASVNEIARTVGVSWPSVAKRRPDAVWSTVDAARWGAMHAKRYKGVLG